MEIDFLLDDGYDDKPSYTITDNNSYRIKSNSYERNVKLNETVKSKTKAMQALDNQMLKMKSEIDKL